MRNQFHSRLNKYKFVLNDDILYTTLGILGLGLCIVFVWRPEIYAQPRYSMWIEFCILMDCCFFLGWVWHLFGLARFEIRRSIILSGNHRLVEVQQKGTSFEEKIPFSIKLRMNWIYIFFLFLIWSSFWLPLIIFLINHINNISLWPLSIFFMLVIAYPVFIFYRSWRPSFYITTGGLTKKLGRFERVIAWSDVCWFVCYRFPGFLGKNDIIYYELSSQTTRVSWIWVRDPHSPFTSWKPTSPLEEYHQQMQALSTLVTEKTGLPLQDLSKPIEKDKIRRL